MSIIDKAALLVAQGAAEQHQSTAARVSRKLEANKSRRTEIAEAQEGLDAERSDLEHMLRGQRQTAEGDWVEVSESERHMYGLPSKSSLNFDLQRAAADERKLAGELEVLRRSNQASMGEMTQAQEKSHKAKSDADSHAKDEVEASRTRTMQATGAAGEGLVAEAQLTARDIASEQRSWASVRMTEATARIEDKVEEAHEHEHAAIDDEASGSFFGALFGAIVGIAAALASSVVGPAGGLLGALVTLGTGLGGGLATAKLVSKPFADGQAQETAWSEEALLDKAQSELVLRQVEGSKKSAERAQAETDRLVASLREAKHNRRA